MNEEWINASLRSDLTNCLISFWLWIIENGEREKIFSLRLSATSDNEVNSAERHDCESEEIYREKWKVAALLSKNKPAEKEVALDTIINRILN